MKILLGWELGAGQGHIQRLVALAQALEANGHTPIFALKAYNLRGIDFPWQRLTPPTLPFSGREISYTFADVLATFGFDDAARLRAHIDAWQAILKAVQPALVITDHAPGLVLAAQNIAPTIVIGSPFAVPPPVETFSPIRCPVPPEAVEREQRVMEAVHQVSEVEGPIGKLLNGDRSFIFSLPELDWYRFWRVNPEYVSAHNLPVPVQRGGTGVWSYLASDYDRRDRVLNCLRPDAEFKPIQAALLGKGVAIHHGGLTTTIACLLAGIPQLVLPRYVEQQLTTFCLIRLGVAQALVNPGDTDLYLAQARTFALTEAAQTQARQLAPWNQNFLPVMIDACLAYLC
jgi:hypothetical protein